jgi:type I restriction enzyme R subunit
MEFIARLAADESLEDRVMKVDHAGDINALISPDPPRREFLGHERLVGVRYTAVKPVPAALEFSARVAPLAMLAGAIRAKTNLDPVDISQDRSGIGQVLDASVSGVPIPNTTGTRLDLSRIDLEALAGRFKESQKKNTDFEALKAAIRPQLETLIELNPTRMDFRTKLIEAYNNGSRNIEDRFKELVALGKSLSEEQKRHVRENITEEGLVVFDILLCSAPELTTDERAEVKTIVRELLARLKDLLVLGQKSSARSRLKLTIEDVLDSELSRAFTPELYQQKCAALFEHMYE